MSRRSGNVEYEADLERSWPERLTDADPYAGDEALPDPAPYSDFQRWALQGGATEEEHRAWDERFLREHRAVLDGRLPWGATDEAAAWLALDHPRRHDGRGMCRKAPDFLPDSFLADLCEDWLPEAGLGSPDRVLGPWADEPGLPRPIRALAAAVMGLCPVMSPAVRPVIRAIKVEPVPPLAVRTAVYTILESPPMLWAVEGGRITAALPLGAGFAPPEVILNLPAGCPAVVGRAVPLQTAGGPTTGWLSSLLPLPALPDPGVLTRRLDLEAQRLRRHDRRLSWEDLLRDRPEVLYRTACEWIYVHDGWRDQPGEGQGRLPAVWRRWRPAEALSRPLFGP